METVKTTPFDAAEFFDSREAQARLLDDALESGDASYVAAALGTIARARGMSSIAQETGLSRQALYAALQPGGNPTLDTVMKVAGAIGVRMHAAVPAAAPLAE